MVLVGIYVEYIKKSKMAQIPKLKSNKKYKDAPRYSLIYDYEGDVKNKYSKMVNSMSLEIVSKMANFIGLKK
jgi:hypothetical protein